MALTLGPSTNRDLLLPLPSQPSTPTALPECCPNDPNQPTHVQPDEPPTQSQLRRLENYPLYDSSGHQHPFSSLFSPSCLRKQRLLVIFIRNFFCGNCQQYLLTITQQLPPSLLPSDVAVAVIGCGAPSLLPSYMELTHCPYPLYTDPSAQLYEKLGMKRSWSLGSRAPQYIQHSLFLGGLKSIAQGLKRLPSGDVTKAGEMDQNGGEFLFKRTGDQGFWTDDWEVDWCHRMRNTRDHTEVTQLRQILDLQESLEFTLKEAHSWAPRMSKERHGKRWTKRSLSSITAVDFAKEAAPKNHTHKRSTTLTQSLSQKGHTVIRTLTLKRPGTAGSWVKDAEPQKRSLTPAVAMPDLKADTTPPPQQQSQSQSQSKLPLRSQSQSQSQTQSQSRPSKTHTRTHSRSISTAQILSLKVQTFGSSNSSNSNKKASGDDSVSESHVALVSVVSPASAVSFRSLTPQIGSRLGSPAGTPLLGVGAVGGGGGGIGAHGFGHGFAHGHGHGHGHGGFVAVR